MTSARKLDDSISHHDRASTSLWFSNLLMHFCWLLQAKASSKLHLLLQCYGSIIMHVNFNRWQHVCILHRLHYNVIVAVIGIGCLLSGASSQKHLWKRLWGLMYHGTQMQQVRTESLILSNDDAIANCIMGMSSTLEMALPEHFWSYTIEGVAHGQADEGCWDCT